MISVSKKIAFFIYGVLFASLVMAPLGYIYRDEIRRQVRVIKASFSPVANLSELRNRLGAPNSVATPGRTKLATNDLPIRASYFSLIDEGVPRDGGHIEAVDDSLILMSRTGDFFWFHDDKLVDLGADLPNNILKYVNQFGLPGGNAMRALSFFIECNDQRLYASYIRYLGSPGNQGAFMVSSAPFNCDSIEESFKGKWVDHFTLEHLTVAQLESSQAAGGALLVDQEQIYISVGYAEVLEVIDRTGTPIAQDSTLPFGKTLTIDKDSGEVAVFSKGHRNIQDMLFLIGEEAILSIEQGPKGGDEINILEQSRNYGWPTETLGTDYNSYASPVFSGYYPSDTMQDPIFSYVPSIAPPTMIQIRDFHEKWEGDLVVGSLKAQSLYHLKLKNDRILFSEPIWVGRRIRSLTEVNSSIVALTDDGYLISLSVDTAALRADEAPDDLVALNPSFSKCVRCHSFTDTNGNAFAPTLKNLLGRHIASIPNIKYSPALSAASGVWDQQRLRAFLSNPRTFATDSTMPNIDLTEDELDEIIAILEQLQLFNQ